jgi:oligopeptide/dipeptide ABC transporter ATP-binding protein
MSDRIAVMYAGKLVEVGPKQDILSSPLHPYTEALLSAVPKTTQRRKRLVSRGEVPDLGNLPSGCVFHPRCQYATEQCKTEEPHLRDVGAGRIASCHLADSLTLQGI